MRLNFTTTGAAVGTAFLLWNGSSEGKQDNLRREAGTGYPALHLRPAELSAHSERTPLPKP